MISVIVPVYNVKKYLLECLTSIDAQTYKDIEVIVVDDGSTDGSGEIADSFCEGKKHFKVYHKKNGGLMSAWIYGIEKSKGDYIGFVDSDDYIKPSMYQIMLEAACTFHADIVMCGRCGLNKKGIFDGHAELPQSYYSEQEMEYIHNHVFPSLRGGNVSSARWNKIFKREIFMQNMKYCKDKSRFCEDRYIVPACLLSAKTFVYIDKPLYVYRMRKSANSKQPSIELYPSLEQLFDIQTQMLKDKRLYEKYENNLEIAKLNYFKIAYQRNLVLSKGIHGKMITARHILSKNNRSLILKHQSECVNKFGKVLLIAAMLKCPLLLVLAGQINRKTISINSDWFD